MYKWILGVCLVVIVGTIVFFLLTLPDPLAGALRLGSGAAITTLDPGQVKWIHDIRASRALHEGLTIYDPKTLKPIPGVAESWTISDDGLLYTFHLRSDARWSNGDLVVAGDFIYSFERVLRPKFGASYSELLHWIKNAKRYADGLDETKDIPAIDFSEVGVRAADDRTLEITLEKPCGFFLDLTSFATYSPVHPASCKRFAKPDGTWDRKWLRPENLVCNGPFLLAKNVFEERLVMKKNPHYWDRENVRTETLVFDMIVSAKTAFTQYENGKLDAIFEVPTSEAQRLQGTDRAGKDFFVFPMFGTYFYRFNCTKAPFDNKLVRQAFSMAIDKRIITEVVTRMGEVPTMRFVPPGTPNYDRDAIEGLPYDPARARELLAQAGYPGGRGLPEIEVLFNTKDNHKRIAIRLAKMWKDNLGVIAKPTNVEVKTLSDRQDALQYDVARSGWIGDYSDANTFLDMWVTGGGNNRTGYARAEYDQLIRDAAIEPDPAARARLLEKAENMLLDDAPILPLYHYVSRFMFRENVHGIHLNPRNIIVAKFLYKD